MSQSSQARDPQREEQLARLNAELADLSLAGRLRRAAELVAAGQTSVSEVVRVFGFDVFNPPLH